MSRCHNDFVQYIAILYFLSTYLKIKNSWGFYHHLAAEEPKSKLLNQKYYLKTRFYSKSYT